MSTVWLCIVCRTDSGDVVCGSLSAGRSDGLPVRCSVRALLGGLGSEGDVPRVPGAIHTQRHVDVGDAGRHEGLCRALRASRLTDCRRGLRHPHGHCQPGYSPGTLWQWPSDMGAAAVKRAAH